MSVHQIKDLSYLINDLTNVIKDLSYLINDLTNVIKDLSYLINDLKVTWVYMGLGQKEEV